MTPPTDGRLLVVGAAVLDDAGRLLCAQRRRPPALAGKWEFPGGKVEPGETPQQALVRECREELGVTLAVGEVLGEVNIPVGQLQVYRARIVAGEPVAYEHEALRWLSPPQWLTLDWIEVDLPLVQELLAEQR